MSQPGRIWTAPWSRYSQHQGCAGISLSKLRMNGKIACLPGIEAAKLLRMSGSNNPGRYDEAAER